MSPHFSSASVIKSALLIFVAVVALFSGSTKAEAATTPSVWYYNYSIPSCPQINVIPTPMPTYDCGQNTCSLPWDGTYQIWDPNAGPFWSAQDYNWVYGGYVPYTVPSGYSIVLVTAGGDATYTYYEQCGPPYTYKPVATFAAVTNKDVYAPHETVTASLYSATGQQGNNVGGWITGGLLGSALHSIMCFFFGCSTPPTVSVTATLQPGLHFTSTNSTSVQTAAAGATSGSFTFTAPAASGTYVINLLGCYYDGSQCAPSSMSFSVQGAACPLPWGGTTPDGTSVTAYQSSSVVPPATCVAQTRTCTNGSLTGSYTNLNCASAPAISSFTATSPVAYNTSSTLSWSGVTNATSCSINNGIGNVSPSGGSIPTPPLTANTTYTLTCSGAISPAATKSVTVQVGSPASCPLPWGGSLASGSSVTAYQTSSVIAPAACSSVAETRICTNGSLSGSYTNQSCVVSSASFSASPSCSITGGNAGCATPVSWNSSGITTAVLTDCGGGLYTSTGPGLQTSPVYIPYNSGCYQIHDGTATGPVLAQVTGTSACSNSVWNGSICQAQYTLTASVASGSGTITPSGVTTVPSGSSQSYTITPAAQYNIVSVTVDGVNKGALTGYTFNNVTANHTITATFAPVPVITSFNASPTPIDPGQTSYLTWDSTGTISCNGTGFATGGATKNLSGVPVTPLTTSSYQLVCTAPGGFSTSPQIATVDVTQPQANITASETRVRAGTTIKVSWTSSGVQTCEVKKNGVHFASGTANPAPGTPDTITSQTTYVLTCTTKGNPVSNSTIVNVVPTFQNY